MTVHRDGKGVVIMKVRALLKRVIPSAFMQRARAWRRTVEQTILSIYGRSRLGSLIYYTFFSSAFRREFFAVAYGRFKYEEENLTQQNVEYKLRRNVHRLEKGLIMRPRRPVFAIDFIEETIDAYTRRLADQQLENGSGDQQEVQWAQDVLTSYFEVTAPHPTIDAARARFEEVQQETALTSTSQSRFAPYKRDLSGPPPVTYDDLLRLAQRRRSVRWFLPKSVPRELVDKAIGVAALSPSACNRQPFQFRIFDDPQMVKKVAALPPGASGFATNIPMMIVVVGRQRAYFNERDRHVIYIDAALATMAFVLALETLGLSSVCINWPDIENREEEMARLLHLEPDERPVVSIAVGYPDPEALVAFSAKKELHNLRRYNAL